MEKYKLYGNKIELLFDSSRHIYIVNGKRVWGVTSIINVLDKPALKYWAVNKAIEVLEKRLLPGQKYDELEIKYMLEDAKKAHTKRLKIAGDIGSATHEWIEQYITAGVNKKPLPRLPVNKEMRNCLKNFFDWVKKNKVKFTASEQKCYSKKYGYAGTFDAEAIIDKKKVIVDFKTGKAIYPEMILQATSYLMAKEEETKEKYNGGIIILRLSKDGNSFETKQIPRKDLANDFFKIFLACLEIYKWKQK